MLQRACMRSWQAHQQRQLSWFGLVSMLTTCKQQLYKLMSAPGLPHTALMPSAGQHAPSGNVLHYNSCRDDEGVCHKIQPATYTRHMRHCNPSIKSTACSSTHLMVLLMPTTLPASPVTLHHSLAVPLPPCGPAGS